MNPVISEAPGSIALWQPIGMRYWRILDRDGRTQHAAPFAVLEDDAVLSPATWSGQHAVITGSYADPFCVYSFVSEQGDFTSFFGNIQTPTQVTRLDDGVALLDSTDLALDVVFDGFGSYEWRDVDELQERAEHVGYWQRDEIPRIRSWGEELIGRWAERQWPFVEIAELPRGLPHWHGPETVDPDWLTPPRSASGDGVALSARGTTT